MGAPSSSPPPPLPAFPAQGGARHFPQWSKTAILTLSSNDEDVQEEVKKSLPEPAGSGFIISGDTAAKVAHLEHSVRFLQEQHRLMLNGLHAEIEALRERNRDLQFQLIFNKEYKESSPKQTSPIPSNEENVEKSEEINMKCEVGRLEKEVELARNEVRVAEAHVVQLRQLVKVQAEKIRELEVIPKCDTCEENAAGATASGGEDNAESRAELRARLTDAEKLVRQLRVEAERRRRELQCMKNSLHASLHATGLDAFGFQNHYHFPPVHHTPDFWREPNREEVCGRGRCPRRVVLLPELGGQPVHHHGGGATVYVNHHTSRPRQTGNEHKNKPQQTSTSNEVSNGKSPKQEQPESRLSLKKENFLPSINSNVDPNFTYPELQVVVTKMIQHGNVSTVNADGNRPRPRRPHRKHAAEHT